MATNNSMTVITSKPFGALSMDVYEDNNHQYYMTREQIGTALEYNNPNKAIQNIHVKNTDRLDPLSTFLKLRNVEGGITKEREYIVYIVCVVLWKSVVCLVSRRRMRLWISAGTLWNL